MMKDDLELLPTEELIAELQRRAKGLLIVMDDNDDGGKGRIRVFTPSHPLIALGMVQYARLAIEGKVE